jgi:hypothetical protein
LHAPMNGIIGKKWLSSRSVVKRTRIAGTLARCESRCQDIHLARARYTHSREHAGGVHRLESQRMRCAIHTELFGLHAPAHTEGPLVTP